MLVRSIYPRERYTYFSAYDPYERLPVVYLLYGERQCESFFYGTYFNDTKNGEIINMLII